MARHAPSGTFHDSTCTNLLSTRALRCFVVGSFCSIHACFLNGAHTGDELAQAAARDAAEAQLLQSIRFNVLLTTNLTMFGSVTFLVGSVLYLPSLAPSHAQTVAGAWLFILGSASVVAGALPLATRQRAPPRADCRPQHRPLPSQPGEATGSGEGARRRACAGQEGGASEVTSERELDN